MSSINSSYHTVAEQIISYNQNVVEILNSINSLVTTQAATVNVTIQNSQGIPTTVALPSLSYLKSEIDRLNNNINSLYGLNDNGATVQTANNVFKKVITVDLNREPKDISQLAVPRTFVTKRNWIFDTLMNPELLINLDLTGKVTDSVRKILSRRYIVEFEVNASGKLTTNGLSAQASFDSTFKGRSNINQEDFLIWHQTTPGVILPLNPNYDEQLFDLEPSQLQYYGIFSVLKAAVDSNNKLFYYLDTLTYTEIATNQPKQLTVGDSLIINVDFANSIYKIDEISTSESNPKIRVTRVEGNQPIPIGTATLKIYSPILSKKTVDISVGFSERNIVFVKAFNTDNNLVSKNWSLGIGYFTNELILSSDDSDNGKNLSNFYNEKVYDYGLVVKDLASKQIPTILGVLPTAPVLDAANFKVVQTNTHLTDTPEANILKNQSSQIKSINSELLQLSDAIQSKNKQLKVTRFTSDADKKQFTNQINTLQSQYDSKSSLKASINTSILNTATLNVSNIQPTFAVRGFWSIPEASISPYTPPQEIVKFEVEYRRCNKNGIEPTIQTFTLKDTSVVNPKQKKNGAFSNWMPYATLSRKRKLDQATGKWIWQLDDISDPDVVNINQLDIPIHTNETIEIRMKSISEVGYPDAPIESPYSNTISISFPDNLNQVTNQNLIIANNAQKEDIKTSLVTELNNKGLDQLLSQKVTVNNATYFLATDVILSSATDNNGVAVDLETRIKTLEDRIKTLEAVIAKSKGELVITIFKNSEQFTIKNNSEINFTVDCESYLEGYTAPGVPTGRVYTNRIYVIKDFLLKISNSSPSTTLGLLSYRTYTAGVNTDVYNSAVPQVFWVNDQDELITSNVTGITKTQLDYQYLWSINYDSIDEVSVSKLSDNIGNLFSTDGNNSITNILSSTEFNVGYSDESVLSFIGNNNSLIDASKWIDTTTSISSTNKLLTTIHPSVNQLENIVENNSSKVHSLSANTNDDITIPINIYFKMNALDTSKTGVNYQYVNLNGVTQNVRHIKKLRFLLDNESDNRPFVFNVIFTINRINTTQKRNLVTSPALLAG
jgi:hypothetical protein